MKKISTTIKYIKGFTLIELLVVMSIIAIIGSIMFGPFQTARSRARDTQSVGDMRILQSYLSLYADDHAGVYPVCLNELSIYGSLPTRSNLNTGTTVTLPCGTLASLNLNLYNYTTYNTGGKVVGYHIYTHLNDMNEALRSSAHCSGFGTGATNCSAGTTLGGVTPDANATNVATDLATVPMPINRNYCKTLTNCILDYHQ